MLLSIQNLYFGYSSDHLLFQNLNLKLGKGEIIAIAGESGCGKSTLLNLIYGLLDWQNGNITFDGVPLFGAKVNLVTGEKDMKLVAQNYNLEAHATVSQNIGKFISNTNMTEKRSQVEELLQTFGLEPYSNVAVKNLSGGQQQRVAIARALALLPKLILLDEPFSNLDFPRKIQLRERLFNYVKKHDISLIISTHEILEVTPWVDQIIVLQDGRLIQNDSPEETYRYPYNRYVAQLFGEVNWFTEKEKKEYILSKKHYFPNEIILDHSGHKALVLESRFGGNHYWNKLQFRDSTLIMHSSNRLDGEVGIRFL